MKNLDIQINQARLRTTFQRRALLSYVNSQNRPISAEQIIKRLGAINPVTIYRILDQFEKVGLLTRVMFDDGIRRYESAGRHHHHLVCDNCGQVHKVEIPNEKQIISRMTAQHHFNIKRHTFEFFGLCQKCH
ncbi:MAG: Fur family transcriptional regulator [Patescibacteria group bacterium]|jgi:Fe2+ or Zn2+ uptake regulation protein